MDCFTFTARGVMNYFYRTLILLATLLSLCFGGGCGKPTPTAADIRRAEEDERERKKELAKIKAEAEEDLRTFAETQLPELQQVLDEIEKEAESRKEKLNLLKIQYERHNTDPSKDDDYCRWSKAVKDLQSEHISLCEERKKAFLAMKKLEHSPEPINNQSVREQRLKKAHDAAADGLRRFEEILKGAGDVKPASNEGGQEKTIPYILPTHK